MQSHQPSTDAPSTRHGIVGLFGRPFVSLDDLFDVSQLDGMHDEICNALARMPTSYTGGSHRSMGIMPAGFEAEAQVDYQEVIRGLDEAQFAIFAGLAWDPAATLKARSEGKEFGEERHVPLSHQQMLWLKMRHRVYFPWKLFAELIPSWRWEDKADPGKRFTKEAEALLPKTLAFVRALPFTHIGRCNILGLEAHDHGTVHRDGWHKPGRKPDQFLTISPRGEKRLFVQDDTTGERVTVQGRIIWFNDHDFHGVHPDPFFRYSMRVDGPFTPEFEQALAARFGRQP